MADQGTTSRGRVALFSPFYYPELISTGKANTALGNELVRLGWNVDVVCSHPVYPNWVPTHSDATLPGTKFFRGGGLLRYPAKPALRRALLELWFAWHSVKTALGISGKIDVALSVYPPSLFALFLNAILPKHIRRVALVHDLQGVYAQQGYSSGGGLLTRLIHWVEKRCFQGSHRCIFFSKDIAKVAKNSFDLDDKRVVVQYPFITMDMTSAPTNALESIMPSGVQHVVYSGALGLKQNPELLARFMAAAAESMPNVQFHIFSAGPKFEAIRREHEAKGRLQFHDLLPEENLGELYARSSVQLIPQAPGSESGSLPSKLPNLLATGAHILAITSPTSDVVEFLQDPHVATVVGEWDEQQFLQGLQNALAAAAAESHIARRERSTHMFPLFQVENLAELVVTP